MSPSCDSVRTFLSAYLDGEATPLPRVDLERHLESCTTCAREAEDLRTLRTVVRNAWVPAPVPAGLRRSVEALRADRHPRRRLVALGGALAALAAALLVFLVPGSTAKASSLAEAAVITHQGLVNGLLPLDVAERDPTRLSALLSARLPFQVVLPKLDDATLKLDGARMVPLDGAYAAVVSYRREGEPVSLAIAPRPYAGKPSGESRTEVFRSVRFESREMHGYHVISWSEGALSYSLVSRRPADGRASCAVCHGQSSGLQRVDEFHGIR
ncbi:zf-HC2 domain-containing protein [Archangium violaceum]|uniref:anti-sigma factor family protein n=1 Tax=Archangium violaceum TaxID=83451 RepID=UPI00193B053A|nr:zf-HC2 domain-containing protein [Archangium violaceum]QRK06526.1 zf-HC2 domain-containing protein [Archangium violaceum]